MWTVKKTFLALVDEGDASNSRIRQNRSKSHDSILNAYSYAEISPALTSDIRSGGRTSNHLREELQNGVGHSNPHDESTTSASATGKDFVDGQKCGMYLCIPLVTLVNKRHPEDCKPCADWCNTGKCRKHNEHRCEFSHLPHMKGINGRVRPGRRERGLRVPS